MTRVSSAPLRGQKSAPKGEYDRAQAKAKRRALEDALLTQIQAAGLPAPFTEVRFSADRGWRFDGAWFDLDGDWLLAYEVEGGSWSSVSRSRHTTGAGYEADCEKYNEAAMRGIRLVRFTSTMVRDGRALATIRRALSVFLTANRVLDGKGGRSGL